MSFPEGPSVAQQIEQAEDRGEDLYAASIFSSVLALLFYAGGEIAKHGFNNPIANIALTLVGVLLSVNGIKKAFEGYNEYDHAEYLKEAYFSQGRRESDLYL